MDLLKRVALACALLSFSSVARAQLASPGELSKAHAHLEGMGNCTKCHPAGAKLSADTCLACHLELGKRVGKGIGYHARLPIAERTACNGCHREHEGRAFNIIDWRPAQGRDKFDHGKTGWALKGKHAQQKCATCHEPRRIVDGDALSLVKRGAETYLGLSTGCNTCHFDEHRGQMVPRCELCHAEQAWKPAPRFDHDKTRFALQGKHKAVACAKCHSSETDDTQPPAFPPPRAKTFAKYSDVEHGKCGDCHEDPHNARFGTNCEGCHSVEGWNIIRQKTDERVFHDRTRYPLRGMHTAVACVDCHGPSRGKPARFKGLAFGKCMDCHIDAHTGQLKDPTCERCHVVNGFRPPRYELEDHAQTVFPLVGAHAAVACSTCHPRRVKPIESAVAKAAAEAGGGKRGRIAGAALEHRLSPFVFRIPHKGERCESCHTDQHVGQLQAKEGCKHCHDNDSFHAVRFDHKESRYPLTGAHQKVACAGCHRRESVNGVEAVRYKPIDLACTTCHADQHVGQFKAVSCDRCHTTVEWKKTRFDHNDKRFTSYGLDGKHGKVACAKCHKPVTIEGKAVVRYKPLPRDCETCHVDFHKGDFKGLAPGQINAAAAAAVAVPKPSDVKGRPATETRCALCHKLEAWDAVTFPHDQTGFPLKGGHQRVACKVCHPTSFRARVADRCAGCHRDVHAATFGQRCEGCHDENSWRTTFNVDAHRNTNFPLSGRHALIPCAECHPQARDRGFAKGAIRCVSCHQQDVDRAAMTSIDHARAGFTTECRGCHGTARWRPARFPSHDRCFRINDGVHAGIRCRGCHTATPPPESLSACMSNNAACTSCHTHDKARTDAIHASRAVQGYDYRDRRCYECHQGD